MTALSLEAAQSTSTDAIQIIRSKYSASRSNNPSLTQLKTAGGIQVEYAEGYGNTCSKLMHQ